MSDVLIDGYRKRRAGLTATHIETAFSPAH